MTRKAFNFITIALAAVLIGPALNAGTRNIKQSHCESKPAAKVETKILKNEKYGFTLEHPADWKVYEPLIEVNQEVSLGVEKAKTENGLKASLTLTVSGDGKVAPDVANSIAAAQKSMLKRSKDAKFSATEEITINGVKAKRFTYEKRKLVGQECSGARYFITIDGYEYSIEFACDPSAYARLIESVDAAVKTFKKV